MTALLRMTHAPLPPLTASGAGAASPGASAAPGVPLVVPESFRARLDEAQRLGEADAARFAHLHDPSDKSQIGDWAVLRLPFAPKADTDDLKELHAIARTRTRAGIERARYWASHGLDEIWKQMLGQYTSAASPAQARAAEALLDDALMVVNQATAVSKGSNLRKRPFVVDPTLKLVVPKPGNNPSFPSGHTSAAYAAALVLAHLMPDRRDEFMSLAQEASWSRPYGGVHFPTDVLAGARLATTITSYLTSISPARPINGTGVTTLQAIPGARALAGHTPIAIAQQRVS